MTDRIFTSNAYKVVEALAQKLGFSTLDEYLQTLVKTSRKESGKATPLGDGWPLEEIYSGIKEGIHQIWGTGLPGGTLLDEPDDEYKEKNPENKHNVIGIDDLRLIIEDVWWENRYELTAKTPYAWLGSAQQLRRSADLVHIISEEANKALNAISLEEIKANGGNFAASREVSNEEARLILDAHLHNNAVMLLGFAIENLTKGILVGRNSSALVADGRFRLKTHDLVKLTTDCKISLTDNERKVLEIASDYAIWHGRYPVPLTVGELRPRQNQSDYTPFDERERLQPKDYRNLVSICDRLFQVYEEEKKALGRRRQSKSSKKYTTLGCCESLIVDRLQLPTWSEPVEHRVGEKRLTTPLSPPG